MSQRNQNINNNLPNNKQLRKSLDGTSADVKNMGRVEAEARARQDTRAAENIAALRAGTPSPSKFGTVVQSESSLRTVQSNKNLTKTRRAVIVRQNSERTRSKLAGFANLLSYAAVGLVAVFLGIFVGNMVVAAKSRVSYDFEEALYTPNWSAIYAANKSKPKTEVSAANAYVMSEYLLMGLLPDADGLAVVNPDAITNYSVTGEGYVAANAMGINQRQTIKKLIEKTGDKIINSSVTTGLIPAAERLEIDWSTKTINSYTTKKIDDKTFEASYPSSPTKTYDLNTQYQAFRDEYGITPYVVLPYLVSEATVTDSTKGQKVEDGEFKDCWQYSLTLDNLTGVMNYVYYMMHISGLNREPAFSKLQLTFIVDDNFRIRSLYVYEKYQIYYMGLPADATAETTYLFSY